MPKSTTSYPEISDIKKDLDSLRTNVVELTKHIQTNGKDRTAGIASSAAEKLTDIKSNGEKQLHAVENRVKGRPLESVAVAFAAGAAISFLMGRK